MGVDIVEEDDAGHITQQFTKGKLSNPKTISGGLSKSVLKLLSNIFMPAGYPATVAPDYFDYQVYDSLQAFSSSVAGLLSSRALLEGVGVGDASATATNALFLRIAQDAVGRLATILFAWRIGTTLEAESKRYRFLADIFNDGALVLDCLMPALPKNARVLAMCFGGILRALCGVAAGGAKAALSVHFARANNVGDLNAKDASQETVIGLLGMLAGTFVVSRVTSYRATWSLLAFLLAIHLFTNYLAVCAVNLRTLNRQRLTIAYNIYRHSLTTGTRPLPSVVSQFERIFWPGHLVHVDGPRAAWGSSLSEIRINVGLTGYCSPMHGPPPGSQTLQTFAEERYLLWCQSDCDLPEVQSNYLNARVRIQICFKKGATPEDQILAWTHGLELINALQRAGTYDFDPKHDFDVDLMWYDRLVRETLKNVRYEVWPNLRAVLVECGWDVESPALLTTEMRCIVVDQETV